MLAAITTGDGSGVEGDRGRRAETESHMPHGYDLGHSLGLETQQTGVNVAPEMASSEGGLASLNSQAVSLALDQLGAASLLPLSLASATVLPGEVRPVQTALPIPASVQGLLSDPHNLMNAGLSGGVASPTPSSSSAMAESISAESASSNLALADSSSASILDIGTAVPIPAHSVTSAPDSSTPDSTYYHTHLMGQPLSNEGEVIAPMAAGTTPDKSGAAVELGAGREGEGMVETSVESSEP